MPSLRLSKIIYVALGLLLCKDVFAFYYEEHRHISQKAFELAINNKLITIPSDLRIKLGSKNLCKNLLKNTSGDCFTLADFPSLAGDHAGSPVLLKWKWLNNSFTLNTAPLIDIISSFRIAKEFNCISSETTTSKPPEIKKFAELVYNSSIGDPASNKDLTTYDSNYANSAAHNCNHFRKTGVSKEDELITLSLKSYQYNTSTKLNFIRRLISFNFGEINPRVREKPYFYASAWYAQLHSAALELAATEGEYNLAAAWLFETFALHFLQDGVSSGHINTPSEGGLSVLTKTKTIHDKKSSEGIEVSIENACREFNLANKNDFLLLPTLMNECKSTPYITRIYGDKNLLNSKITEELAIYLTYQSLVEFSEAIKNKAPKLSHPVLNSEYETDPAWVYIDKESEPLYILLFTWWESAGSKEANSLMNQAAQKYFKDGKIKALTLWPLEKKNMQTITAEQH